MPEQQITHAIAAAAGGGAAWVINWLTQARRENRDAANHAIDALEAALEGVRADMVRLCAELAEERLARARAEDTVRSLREDLHSMANAMQRHGVALPDLASWRSAQVVLPG